MSKFKQKILDELIQKAKAELAAAEKVSDTVKTMTNASDMKQEGKYDTRAIEAGYLAGAQAKRVEELKLEVQMLEEIPVKDFGQDSEVVIGALVDLEFNQKLQTYFVISTAGGTMLNIDGKPVLVISVFSPIGNEVLGLKLGDRFEIETPKETREYLIKNIV